MNDIRKASAASLVVSIGGMKRRCSRLTMAQIADLAARIEGVSIPTIYDVHRWASTPIGSVAVIAVACQDDVTEDEVSRWGSMVERATVAATITAESIVADGDVDEGELGSDPT